MMLFWRRVRNCIGRTSLPHCRGRTPTLSCATSSARNATGTTSENGVTSTSENGVGSRPENRVQVRQTTKQVVVQGFGFTTDHKDAPRRRLHQSPPQSQQMCCFHARRPTCYGNLSATKLKVIIVFYHILPRTCWRFAQVSNHVPRVGRGRCAEFFVSPVSDLLHPQPPNHPRTRKKENIVRAWCSVEGGKHGSGWREKIKLKMKKRGKKNVRTWQCGSPYHVARIGRCQCDQKEHWSNVWHPPNKWLSNAQ
jgi:hypothetical protein